MLVQNGYHFIKNDLFGSDNKNAILNLELPEAIIFQLKIFYKRLYDLESDLLSVKEKILFDGKIFENEIDKLVGIDGISVFIALAIMTDIADITRFKSAKKLNSSHCQVIHQT